MKGVYPLLQEQECLFIFCCKLSVHFHLYIVEYVAYLCRIAGANPSWPRGEGVARPGEVASQTQR